MLKVLDMNHEDSHVLALRALLAKVAIFYQGVAEHGELFASWNSFLKCKPIFSIPYSSMLLNVSQIASLIRTLGSQGLSTRSSTHSVGSRKLSLFANMLGVSPG
jgi:hypothetical protein